MQEGCASSGYTLEVVASADCPATLERVFPNEPKRHVSRETIHTAICAQPRGKLRRQLVACLRQGRSTRLPRTRGTDRRGQVLPLARRPVNKRLVAAG